jgi:hypothetical protein
MYYWDRIKAVRLCSKPAGQLLGIPLCMKISIFISLFLFGLLPLGSHAATQKTMTRQMLLYIERQTARPGILKSESEFLAAWNAKERDEVRARAKDLIDLQMVLELNRESAQIWDEILGCHGAAVHPEVSARTGYLVGQICPVDPSRAPDLTTRLKGLQNKIENFMASTWIGGNDNKAAAAVELPATHVLFNQLLAERISLRLSKWQSEFSPVAVYASQHLRESDRPDDSKTAEANAVLGGLLLWGATPKIPAAERGGFYVCPASGIVKVALGRFRGDAQWKAALVQLGTDLTRACGNIKDETVRAIRAASPGKKVKKDKTDKWDALAVYRGLALRFGASPPRGVKKVNWDVSIVNMMMPFSLVGTTYKYEGKSHMVLSWTLLLPFEFVGTLMGNPSMPWQVKEDVPTEEKIINEKAKELVALDRAKDPVQ